MATQRFVSVVVDILLLNCIQYLEIL